MTDEKLQKILRELSGLDTFGESDSLQADLGLDILSMVNLLLAIEDAYGVTLNESDMDPMTLLTVADVSALVKKYRAEA